MARLIALDLSLGTAGVVATSLVLVIRLVQAKQSTFDRDDIEPSIFDVRVVWPKSQKHC